MSEADRNAPRPKYKRSARNYLLDKHFQLKYTGFLVGIAVTLSVVLGALLWRASSEVLTQSHDTAEQNKKTVEQGKETIAQSQKTVERGQENIKLSDELNKLVSTTIEGCYPGEEGLLESFKKSTKEKDDKLKDEQKKLESDKLSNEEHNRALEAQAQKVEADVSRLENNLQKVRIGFMVLLLALVGAIGVAGIVFTHKIAGPIFKMKRLFRQVGEGKLVLREKLRKGDELQHFFEAFEGMVDHLREKQQREIDDLDGAIKALEREGLGESAAVERLKTLRGEMEDHLTA
ncbi:MAG: HAMP domain-containing protein [Polyangiaceae bacterium]|nr:HAMP domain-containing protein [Polyangiaceae bacterium]